MAYLRLKVSVNICLHNISREELKKYELDSRTRSLAPDMTVPSTRGLHISRKVDATTNFGSGLMINLVKLSPVASQQPAGILRGGECGPSALDPCYDVALLTAPSAAH